MNDLNALRRRAVDYARAADFGAEARIVNLRLSELEPQEAGVWTRLGRCHMAAGELEEAETAFRQALALNDQNTVARNWLAELSRNRRFARVSTSSASTGFDKDFFDELGTARDSRTTSALGTKVESLLMSLNDLSVSETIVEKRRQRDRQGTKLFRRNSFHWQSGHVYAFHHGGRWEPQLNIGLFSAQVWPTNCLRAGIGFNLSLDGMDRNPLDGQGRALAYFAAFQRAISARWRKYLIEWMTANSGHLHFGDKGPRPDWPATRQVEWLTTIANPALEEWIFIGRWFYAHKPQDARALADMRTITNAIGATFRELLPLWTDAWNNAAIE